MNEKAQIGPIGTFSLDIITSKAFGQRQFLLFQVHKELLEFFVV